MKNNPKINALMATTYIVVLSTIMYYGPKQSTPDKIIGPIAVMSIFTLSAAVMGYLFLGEPIQLYFNNKKKEAVSYFVQTVAAFGIITLVLLFIAFSGVFK